MTLSIAMIVRDEEASIARVLADAAQCCDELVVVDTGSTDATKQLAAQAGARVLDFVWIDDFAAARNHAFDACTGDWILWLDADDRLTPEVQQRLADAKRNMLQRNDIDAVVLPYRVKFGADGRCSYSFPRERILRRAAGLRWHGVVHEVITVPAGRSVFVEELWVEHRPDPTLRAVGPGRNLRILERAVSGGDDSPRTLFYYGNELRDQRRFADATRAYRRYLALSDLPWERHAVLLHLATCYRELGDTEAALRHVLEAVAVDSTRAEAYVRAGVHFYDKHEWTRAIPLFVAATACSRPADGFVDEPDYTWRPWDYLTVCYYQTGQRSAALHAADQALPDNPDRARVLANIGLIRQLPG